MVKGLVIPNYEDLQEEIEESQQAVMTKETIHSYFKK